VEFARVDPHDDVEFAAWFGVLSRSESLRLDGREGGWRPEEWRARALDEAGAVHHRLYRYGERDAPVAVGDLELTRDDNLTWTRGDLFVEPARRREGHGSAMLMHLEACARELGRETLVIHAEEGAREMGSGPSRGFAPLFGYEVAEENVTRHLNWPLEPGELARLEGSFAASVAHYEILSWREGAPSELLLALGAVRSRMPVEVPDAGIDAEEEHWDEARVRHHEHVVHEMGRDLLSAAARHRASGDLVGFSELTVSREQPGTAYQWDTLVLSAHRGHHLGALLKMATMRLLEAGGYDTHTIYTSNNALNAAMIAVNEELGFRPAGASVTWRKKL
jgi:GNAT superfamily N-acetyltransferase